MKLDLKRLIRSVQQELEDAQRERESSGQKPLFKVEELTVELTFAIAEETSGKGGFSIKIFEIGGSEKVAENETHKLTLRLSALHGDASSEDQGATGTDQSQAGTARSAKTERDPRIQEALGLYPSRKRDPEDK